MEKHGQGTLSTKMGADKLAENTPNVLKFVCPSPKVWDFQKKKALCGGLHWFLIPLLLLDLSKFYPDRT